jgi:3D (Asp-Asp-Asp) domain-containing protein
VFKTNKKRLDVFIVVLMTITGFIIGTIAGFSAKNDVENAFTETTVSQETTEQTTVEETTEEVFTTEDELTTVRCEDIPKLRELGTFKYYWYCREEYPHICNDGAPYLTKLETKPTDKTVAVDPDIIPLGSKLYINGEYYIAEDTGDAIKGNRIDINCATHSEALNNGTGYVKVFLVVE